MEHDESGKLCEVCKKRFKNLGSHLRAKHQMSLAEYDDYVKNSHKMNIEAKGNTKVTLKEREKRIFGEQERDVNRPLKDFLDEFDITEKELREIARKFMQGKPIDVKTSAKNKYEVGEKEAEKLKDKTEEVTVYRAETADILLNKYNFEVIKCVGRKGDVPKHWVLKKR
jgi:hypothetical protein